MPVLQHHRGGELPVPGGQRMPRRLGRRAVGREPAGGAAVQLGDALGRLVAQLDPQQLGEELVVAVPAVPALHRDHEGARPLQLGQHRLAVVAAGERVRQLAVEPVQDRGAQQHRPDRRRLARQHLAGQVVGDAALVAGEFGDEAAGVGVIAERQRRQPQAGRPPLGVGTQQGHVARPQVQALAAQQLCGLLQGEGQLGDADLGQLAAGAELVQLQPRVGPRGDHQAQCRRAVADQELHAAKDRLLADLVEVVEHQHHRRVDPPQRVEQRRQLDLAIGGGDGHGGAGRQGAGALQGGAHVRPEPAGVVVVGLQREPRHRAVELRAGGPRTQQHRLAESRRRAEQRQAAVHARAEHLQQPRAQQQAGGQVRHDHFGAQQRRLRPRVGWMLGRVPRGRVSRPRQLSLAPLAQLALNQVLGGWPVPPKESTSAIWDIARENFDTDSTLTQAAAPSAPRCIPKKSFGEIREGFTCWWPFAAGVSGFTRCR